MSAREFGVEARTGVPVTAIDANGFALGAHRIAARTVLSAVCCRHRRIAASPLGRALSVPVNREGH